MGGLILGVNTLYMLSCFLKQFALVGKGLRGTLAKISSTQHPFLPFSLSYPMLMILCWTNLSCW